MVSYYLGIAEVCSTFSAGTYGPGYLISVLTPCNSKTRDNLDAAESFVTVPLSAILISDTSAAKSSDIKI